MSIIYIFRSKQLSDIQSYAVATAQSICLEKGSVFEMKDFEIRQLMLYGSAGNESKKDITDIVNNTICIKTINKSDCREQIKKMYDEEPRERSLYVWCLNNVILSFKDTNVDYSSTISVQILFKNH